MAENKFSVEDNVGQIFSSEEIAVRYRKDEHVSRVWTMSYPELVDLQTSIATFLADGNG